MVGNLAPEVNAHPASKAIPRARRLVSRSRPIQNYRVRCLQLFTSLPMQAAQASNR